MPTLKELEDLETLKKSTDEVAEITLRCVNCDGSGFVCENHPEVPWQDGDGCCGAAGMLCSCRVYI